MKTFTVAWLLVTRTATAVYCCCRRESACRYDCLLFLVVLMSLVGRMHVCEEFLSGWDLKQCQNYCRIDEYLMSVVLHRHIAVFWCIKHSVGLRSCLRCVYHSGHSTDRSIPRLDSWWRRVTTYSTYVFCLSKDDAYYAVV